MTNVVKRLGLAAALLGLSALAAGRAKAGQTIQFNASAGEWSSSTVANPPAIVPIGGSGQVNGGFVVSTSSTDGAEIDLRAELRGAGLLPQTNDGVTATYFAPVGSPSGNLAKWNFDFGIDLRSTTHTLGDYTATLTVTDGATVTPINIQTVFGLDGTANKLVQESENPGFNFLSGVFPSFNPNAVGNCQFDLLLTPKFSGGDTLEAKIDVMATPEPSTLISAGMAGLVGLVFAWRKRRAKAA